jgi:hypothetical protein
MRIKICLLCLLFSAAPLPAVDFWQHPEAAEKNSLFANAVMPALSFSAGFSLPRPQIGLDYMLPIPLPVSVGAFLKIPWPELEGFGIRAAYHINLGDRKTDLYLLHVVEFRFERGAVSMRFLDFRLGARYLFNGYLCVLVETDFFLRGIVLGVSLKLF